jgi:hypothetical protein
MSKGSDQPIRVRVAESLRTRPLLLKSIAAVAVLLGFTALTVLVRAEYLGFASASTLTWKKVALGVAGASLLLGGLWFVRGEIVRGARWLATPRRLVPLLVALVVYGGAYLIMKPDPTGDQPHYMIEAYSLAFDRDRDLRHDYRDPDRFGPMFGPFVADGHAFNYGSPDNVNISFHNVGVPALLLPAVAVGKDLRLMRWEYVLLAAFTAYMLLSVLRALGIARGWLLYGVWGSVAFSLPFVSYSSQIYPELPGALLLLLGLRAAVEPAPRPWMIAGGASAAALMPWLHMRFGLLSVALVAALVIRAQPLRGSVVRKAALAIVPLVVSLGAMAIAFAHWYGSPSPTAPFRFSDSHFDLEWAYRYSIGGLFNPEFGWFPFAPLHVLALAGAVFLALTRGRWAAAGSAVAIVYLLLVASATGISTAYSYPGRLQLVIVPLAAIPLLALLKEVPWTRLIALPLTVVTFAFTIEGVRNQALLLPQGDPNVSDLPLGARFATWWPQVADLPPPAGFPELRMVLAYVVGMAAIGLLAAGWATRASYRA